VCIAQFKKEITLRDVQNFNDTQHIVDAYLCTLAVSAAMALEILMDYLESPKHWVDDRAERSLLVLIIAIPGILLMNNPTSQAFVFWHVFQVIGSFAPVFSLCLKLVPRHFKSTKVLSSYFGLAAGGALSIAGSRKSLYSWENVSAIVFLALAMGIVMEILLGWIVDIHKRRKADLPRDTLLASFGRILSHDEVWCMVYVTCTFVALVVVPLVTFILRSFLLQNWSFLDVCANIYSLAGFVVLMNSIPNRARQRTARMIVAEKIKLNRSTVRYISHEIRSPLNIVENGIRFVRERVKNQFDFDEQVSETLNDVEHASNAASCIVDDLLNFEKIESGNFHTQKKLEPASSCLSEMAKRCRVLASEKMINFSIVNQVNDSNPNYVYSINIDIIKMEQVIRNLIVNAIKFTPAQGSITVLLKHEKATTDFSLNYNSSHQDTFFISQGWNNLLKSVKLKPANHSLSRLFNFSGERRKVYADFQPPNSRLSESNTPPCKDGNIHIEITDSGAGFTKQQYDRVFGEFVQFNPNSLQGGGGSGLGLWICKEIIQQHQGTITFSSDGEGCGTTFSIKLDCFLEPRQSNQENICGSEEDSQQYVSPRRFKQLSSLKYYMDGQINKQRDEEKTPIDFDAEKTLCKATFNAWSLRVLIVDDSAMNRKLLNKMLHQIFEELSRSQCYGSISLSTVEADDGLSAVALMQSTAGKFDLVLIDNIMLTMNGPEAAQKMRHDGFSGLIIGVTGNVLETDVRDFIAHGANKVLKKPVSLDLLKEVALELCRKHSSGVNRKRLNSVGTDTLCLAARELNV